MSEVKRFTFELFHCNGGDMTPDDEGEYVSYEDYAEWQQKLDALAAENAALKSSIPSLKHVDLDNDNIDDVSLAKDIGLNDAVTLMNRWKGETPATDAYLNAVRADAVEDAAKQLYGQGYTFEVLTKWRGEAMSDVIYQISRVTRQTTAILFISGLIAQKNFMMKRLRGGTVRTLYATAQPVSDGCKVPEGWKLVPIEPTTEMKRDFFFRSDFSEWRSEHKDGLECYYHDNVMRIWRAMLAAAPGGQDS
ncbi:hypothetical protein GH714_044133 [Hevea brasiliensis]|uniref:Uncharacterized protein n=1 Tax=Hevea brasiliensis TaxID=3981 RepID=A0A6A6K4H8_HEVBR|nr:hypothetical protein GH714_044133 [Hevea brasiliensis]